MFDYDVIDDIDLLAESPNEERLSEYFFMK